MHAGHAMDLCLKKPGFKRLTPLPLCSLEGNFKLVVAVTVAVVSPDDEGGGLWGPHLFQL